METQENELINLPKYADIVKKCILGSTGLFMVFYGLNIKKYGSKPLYLLSISQSIRTGLDRKHACNERYRVNSYMIFFFSIVAMVISEQTILTVYTTDSLSKVTRNDKFRIGIVTSSLVVTISWIVALGITIDSEGDKWHKIPAALFFLISSVYRLIFLSSKTDNKISKFKKERLWTTGVAFICLIYGALTTSKEDGSDQLNNCNKLIKKPIPESLLGFGEITLLILLLWDRVDLCDKLIAYHSKKM